MHEARFYISEKEGKVRCTLCPHECLVAEGKYGSCKVRLNQDGKLFSEVYGRIAALNLDPIEKKPLYHFFPGQQILSVGTAGCNLHCLFCQNDSLSQHGVDENRHSITTDPAALVRKALAVPGNIGIAYTYNEPFVFYEFMADCARQAHQAGLRNVVVSNGYLNPAPLQELLPLIDAFNIDLKAFSDDFYRRQTGGRLQPVLESLQIIAEAKKHLEITNLVIPTLNDSAEEFESMVQWIAEKLGKAVPLHLSRYFPAYRLSLPPTPSVLLEKFYRIARGYLDFVYLGNVSDDTRSATYCPNCLAPLITRHRYETNLNRLTPDGKCADCGYPVPVVLN